MKRIAIHTASWMTALLFGGASPAAGQTFTDVTDATGVRNPGLFSTNFAWGDYDLDGNLDLYVTNWGTAQIVPPNKLYRNNGDSSFTDVADALGVDLKEGNSTSAAWGDFDNDGDVDLYVSDFSDQDFLYENVDATFSEIGRSRALVNLDKRGNEVTAGWADYDNDGDLDIYVGKYYHDNELANNDGEGGFDLVLDLGLGDRRDTNAFNWVDYDNDGDLDLYVVNREQENGFYRNELSDGGQFSEIACALTVANTEIGQNATWGDYDNDGDMDVFVANIGANSLYRNDGDDTFVDVAAAAAVREVGSWLAAMAAWSDYDGDGNLDLYLATGADRQFQQDVLFASNGDGTFRNATAEAAIANTATPHMAAGFGDFDGDGAPDLYRTNGFGSFGPGNTLLRNDTPDSLFIVVRVRGKGPAAGGNNLLGLGAQVRLFDANQPDTLALVAYRQILPGSGPAEAVFGAPGGPYNVQVIFPGNLTAPIQGSVSGGDEITIDEP